MGPDPGAMVPRTPPGKPPRADDSDDDALQRFIDEGEFGDADENTEGRVDDELHLLGHVASNRVIDVAEIVSPPRVTKQACKFDLRPGFALDLTTNDPADGKPWDFRDPIKRTPFAIRGCFFI